MTTASTSDHLKARKLLSFILEADTDDLDMSLDLSDEPYDPADAQTTVTKHGRWKLVNTPSHTFLISYLTPVAYRDKATGEYFQTKTHWSRATGQHIQKWQGLIHKSPEHQGNKSYHVASDYGPGYYVSYPTFKKVPQEDISQLFSNQMAYMNITAKDRRRLHSVPNDLRDQLIDTGNLSIYRRYP